MQTIKVPESACHPRHAIKEQWATDYVHWLGDDGFACGSVEYKVGAWPYRAEIENWSGPDGNQHFDFSNYADAERFVEGWCKP